MNDESATLHPGTVREARELICSHSSVIPSGNGTKLGPQDQSATGQMSPILSATEMTRIIAYEPSEFTITVLAGTPVAEIADVLAERQQYLPFDPLLVEKGATIGGTVAADAGGVGQFRYGGVRDFLLEACLITGHGEIVRAGAKVVKNSAGFDIPKLIVGSFGQLGFLTEFTFKVFPRPPSVKTIKLKCESQRQAIDRIVESGKSQWELDAVEYCPLEKQIFFRIAGPAESNESIAATILRYWGDDASEVSKRDADLFWKSIREFEWSSSATFIKVPILATVFPDVYQRLSSVADVNFHLSIGGAVIWLAAESSITVNEIDADLRQLLLPGIVFQGSGQQRWLGFKKHQAIEQSIKQAMDPHSRFPTLRHAAD